MKSECQTLTEQIEKLTREASRKTAELNQIRRNCKHNWSKVSYEPSFTGGYLDPGDPPGTMGVDRQLPCYIDKREHPLWKRTCLTCGLVQTTTTKITKHCGGEICGCGGSMEIPNFGD